MTDQHDDQHSDNIRTWIGTAAADRSGTDVTLKVHIPSLMPNSSGQVNAASSAATISLMNMPTTAGGPPTPLNMTANTTNAITCYWWGESNRAYPPNVKKGEQVEVKKLADSDRYYWTSLGRDQNLRTTETHRIQAANNPVAKGASAVNAPLTDENSMFIEISTDNKRFLIKTSMSNGEKNTYQILIDTAKGQISICDNANNEFLIDSSVPRVRMRNNKGSMIDLADQDIIIAAARNLILKADQQIYMNTPTITFTASGTIAFNAKGIALNGSDKIVLTGSQTGINSTNTQIQGNLKAGPTQTVSGTNGALPSAITPPTTNINNGSSS
jgi:hypothetical protein